ncbi:type VI secretion system-associated protein VasI [Pseudomonas helleri]|uniref:type VI secretion system-associated protein VasI n=1 Tax=Pseudomonas helleri TaxID=1608996 RepID=UPI00243225DD|nr:type VI secretion system-associated protein VasI [Pseudomonas helleri]
MRISSGLAWALGACLLVMGGQQALAMPAARDCTTVVSSLKRLECFDQAAGTPIRTMAPQPVAYVGRMLPIVDLVQRNEAKRSPGDFRFLISHWPEPDNERAQRVVISAPALGAFAPRPTLAISCESSITRLQLVLDEPVKRNKLHIQLLADDKPLSTATWQVMDEAGLVVEFSRGLPTITLLRQIMGSQRLELKSTQDPALNGLVFDAQGLDALIAQERQACRW